MPGLEAGVDQPAPDRRQLLDPRPEQVDPLPAGDFGVEPEVPGHLADDDQLVRRDLPARDPRHDRVRAVALHVGQEVVVGVLQRRLFAVEDVSGTQRGEDRGDDRLADVAAPAPAVPGHHVAERADPADPDDVEQLLPGVLEVLAQRRGLGDAGLAEQLLHQRYARSAGGAGAGARLDGGDIGAALLPDRGQDRVLGDRVARTDLGAAGQGVALAGAGAKRSGPNGAIAGSTPPSSTRRAIASAVIGASRMPLR